MNAITASLWIYGLTIVFALAVALIIRGMGSLVKRLGLDRNGDELDITIPSSNQLKEEEMIAVVVAIARSKHEQGD